MADVDDDNLQYTTTPATVPAGTIVATDVVEWGEDSNGDAQEAHVQLVKLLLGDDGNADTLVYGGQRNAARSISTVPAIDAPAQEVTGDHRLMMEIRALRIGIQMLYNHLADDDADLIALAEEEDGD